MKRVSLKHIADKVGVSNATVSLVLSGKEKEGRVSKEVAEKIKRTAQEMNYHPNSVARSLRVGKTKTICLILADISNLFFASLAFHVQEEAEKYGYTIIIANTNESVDKMRTIINMYLNRQVDGFLVVPAENSEDDIQRLVDNNISLVLIDRYFPFINCNYVVIDNYKASFEATKLLLDNGCEKIALITYKNKLPHVLERKSGYMDAMTYAGMGNCVCVKEIRYSHFNEDINRVIAELFENNNNVEGIFFSTNSISMEGLKCLRRKGVLIPKDVKVVCFDKSEAFDLLPDPIPYVLQPIADIGKKAVEIIVNLMEGDPVAVQSIKMQSTLYKTLN